MVYMNLKVVTIMLRVILVLMVVADMVLSTPYVSYMLGQIAYHKFVAEDQISLQAVAISSIVASLVFGSVGVLIFGCSIHCPCGLTSVETQHVASSQVLTIKDSDSDHQGPATQTNGRREHWIIFAMIFRLVAVVCMLFMDLTDVENWQQDLGIICMVVFVLHGIMYCASIPEKRYLNGVPKDLIDYLKVFLPSILIAIGAAIVVRHNASLNPDDSVYFVFLVFMIVTNYWLSTTYFFNIYKKVRGRDQDKAVEGNKVDKEYYV